MIQAIFPPSSLFAANRGAWLPLAVLATLMLAMPTIAQAEDQGAASPEHHHPTMDHSTMDHSTMDHGSHDMQHMEGHDHAEHLKSVASSGVARTEVTYAIPDVTLTDMAGKKVRVLDELDSQAPVIVSFIFTTCTAVCPITTSTLAEIQKNLTKAGKPFRLISISIDPEEDTPARMRDYAARFDASKEWHFLTGSLDNIVSVQRAFDAYRGNKMNHPPLIYIRESAGQPWVRFEGFVAPGTVVEEYDRQLAASKVGAK